MAEDMDPVARAFVQEVPEIASGQVEIKAIARIPGYRSKVAVHSGDPNVDCVDVCVGRRAIRIRNIVDLLGGERVELVRWSDSPEVLIARALVPADIEKVTLYPSEHRAIVLIKHDQRSLVLGRWGITRKLASELSGWKIQFEEL